MIQKIWNLQQVRAHNHSLSCGNQNGCIVVVVAEVENQFRMCLIFTSKSKVYRQGKWSENTFGLREAFIWKTFSKKTNKQFLQIKASLIVHFCIAGFGTRQDQASKLFSWVQKDAGCTSFGALSLSSSLRDLIGLCGWYFIWSWSYWWISKDFTKDFYFHERTRLLPNCLRSTLRIWFPWRCHRHLKNWNFTSEKKFLHFTDWLFVQRQVAHCCTGSIVHNIALYFSTPYITKRRGHQSPALTAVKLSFKDNRFQGICWGAFM